MTAVAVDILTGFLGSGKTTLLRHVLDHGLRGQRVAVVMNEIGEIGIDGRVVTGLSRVERMVELSSGCICCTIDDYRFDQAMQEIVDTVQPHLVIIESTGLADPEPLAYRVQQAGLALDAVITVVDAAHVTAQVDEAAVAGAQIAAADFLVLNKTDLVSASTLDAVDDALARRNPRAERFRTSQGAIDSAVLFATGVAGYRERARTHSDHRQADGFGSFVHRTPYALDQDAFEAFVRHLPRAVVRAKGIVRVHGRDWQCLFNVTCGRADLTWVRLPRLAESQAVFIGRDLDRHESDLRAALTACEVMDRVRNDITGADYDHCAE